MDIRDNATVSSRVPAPFRSEGASALVCQVIPRGGAVPRAIGHSAAHLASIHRRQQLPTCSMETKNA